jgi:hypothetical protein
VSLCFFVFPYLIQVPLYRSFKTESLLSLTRSCIKISNNNNNQSNGEKQVFSTVFVSDQRQHKPRETVPGCRMLLIQAGARTVTGKTNNTRKRHIHTSLVKIVREYIESQLVAHLNAWRQASSPRYFCQNGIHIMASTNYKPLKKFIPIACCYLLTMPNTFLQNVPGKTQQVVCSVTVSLISDDKTNVSQRPSRPRARKSKTPKVLLIVCRH